MRAWIVLAFFCHALDCAAEVPGALRNALAQRDAANGPGHAATLSFLYSEAAAAVNARRWDEGIALQAELVRRVEALRAGAPSPERRRELFATWVGRYREYAAILALRGRHEEAFRVAELTKARTLLELSTARRALDSGLVPAAERQQLGVLETRAAALEASLAQVRELPRKRQQVETERDEVLRELAARMQSLESRIPKLAELSKVRAPGIAEARALLPAGSVYLSYLVQDNLLMLTVLSPERGLLTILPGPIPNLGHSIAAFRYLIGLTAESRRVANYPSVWRRKDGSYVMARLAPEPEATQTEDPDELAQYLGEKLLAPVAARLERANRIIVSPDGSLAMLPFEALRIGNRYLIEKHEVQYTQSMGMYALSRARAADYQRLAGRLDLLAVGGALYEEYVQLTPLLNVHSSLLAPPPSGTLQGTVDEFALPQAFKSFNINWRNLPASELEVESVAQLFAPDRTRLLKGGDATEERLWRLNASGELARYRYLLFATHGFASNRDPRLNSVVLGQIGNHGGFDGYVTAAEWPLYDLRSDLVVVSACNTGFGPIVEGEGLMGLPFALHLAGNRNTLLTLWQVADYSTADLVVQFFHHVRAGADHGTALALTKRSFLADPRRRNPYYWAPFVLYGS